MSGSLKESQACAEMAELLSGFLPGSGSPQWTGHVTFATVAQEVGVGAYWRGSSKVPAITALLDQTLRHQRRSFEPLILAIVRNGLVYRRKRDDPVRRDEITRLNTLLRRVGFQFPDLIDSEFLASLPVSGSRQADAEGVPTQPEPLSPVSTTSHLHVRLATLREQFYNLCQLGNRQQAGFELERLLRNLFDLFGMAPRAAFKFVGEQIDGSFELDNETYLIEAKWESHRTPTEPLRVFYDKVQAKSAFTRGVFFTMSGLSDEARNAFPQGRRARFIVVDGDDLMLVLEGLIALDVLLRAKQRKLAEEGKMMVSARELFSQASAQG